MKSSLAIIAAAAALAVSPALAQPQAVSFTIVNNTEIAFTDLKIRRFGTADWVPLRVTPVPVAPKGGTGAVEFSNQDCSFDLQATLPGGQVVVWSGVTLCEARIVTLNRSPSGNLWVDYR